MNLVRFIVAALAVIAIAVLFLFPGNADAGCPGCFTTFVTSDGRIVTVPTVTNDIFAPTPLIVQRDVLGRPVFISSTGVERIVVHEGIFGRREVIRVIHR